MMILSASRLSQSALIVRPSLACLLIFVLHFQALALPISSKISSNKNRIAATAPIAAEPLPQTSPTPVTNTLAPTADAHIRDGSANTGTNFGTAAVMEVKTDTAANTGFNRDAYLKFDLSTVSGNVTNAKLRIYAALSATGTVGTSVSSVATINWIESGTGSINWTNKPARGATALASASVTGTSFAWYELDVTSALTTWF